MCPDLTYFISKPTNIKYIKLLEEEKTTKNTEKFSKSQTSSDVTYYIYRHRHFAMIRRFLKSHFFIGIGAKKCQITIYFDIHIKCETHIDYASTNIADLKPIDDLADFNVMKLRYFSFCCRKFQMNNDKQETPII